MAPLLAELGHPAPPEELAGRLRELLALSSTERVWVAETAGEILGVAAVHLARTLHRPRPVGRITVLVVAPQAQGRGLGRALVAVCERQLADWGAERVELTSGTHRLEAHEFYRRLGYRQEGVKFARRLGADRGPG